MVVPGPGNAEVWAALVDQQFLEEKQHAGRAGSDGHACKNGECDTNILNTNFLSNQKQQRKHVINKIFVFYLLWQHIGCCVFV